MSRGKAWAGMMNFSDDEIRPRGSRFSPAARITSIVTLAASLRPGASGRRPRRAAHAFLRAMIGATDWVMDRKNNAEIIQPLLPENKSSRALAEEMYQESTSPRFGFTPQSRIDLAGIPRCWRSAKQPV